MATLQSLSIAAIQSEPSLSSCNHSGYGCRLCKLKQFTYERSISCGEPQKLSFTSFGRHGGATESMGSGLTELELMKKGQWSSTKAMGNYLHGNDAGKRKAQLNRIAKRGTRV